jgi:phospholipase/carboxylesterase
VIWLHGLGADGHDFPPIVPELGLADELGIRWIFPHAPAIPVTLNGGMVMPAWYDISEADLRRRHDEPGIRRSVRAVEELIERERSRGLPSRRILLAGFSQGGAVAAFTALSHRERLAGLVMLSTYLVLADALETERDPGQDGLPIFQAHGRLDPMVPHSRGVQARDWLAERGYAVEWRDYAMAHQVCLEEIADLSRWIDGTLRRALLIPQE